MFDTLKEELKDRIKQFCQEEDLPSGKLELRDVPFSGEWGGVAAPLFPLAAADPNKSLPVPQHAQALAEKIR